MFHKQNATIQVHPRSGNNGFTLIQLLIVIAVVAVLAVLTIAASRSAIENSRRVACVAKVRTFGAAITMYAADHRGRWPYYIRDHPDGGAPLDTWTTSAARNYGDWLALRNGLIRIASVLALLGLSCSGIALELSSNHPPVIVKPLHASPAEAYAAAELSEFLGRVLGCEVVVVSGDYSDTRGVPIILGRQPENHDLLPLMERPEQALIEVDANRVRIVGGSSTGHGTETQPQHDRGVLYGAYDLLEEIGVRWYRPEDWGDHVPCLKSISIKEGRRMSEPAYRYRYGLYNYQTFTPFPSEIRDPEQRKLAEEERELVVRWLVRNRHNTNLFADGKPRYGGEYQVNFAHAYAHLVPKARYFSSNPEYYSLINGQRSSDPYAQLCVSNPEVENIVFEAILSQFDKRPNMEIASLDPNDYALWCECDGCRALDDPQLKAGHSGQMPEKIKGISMSNRVVEFGNRIARRVAKARPGKRVGWYAYAMHTEVPTKVKALEPNVVIMPVAFAGSFSDYSRGLYDARSKPNQRFLEILKGYHRLSKQSSAPLFVHDYWSGYAWQGPLPVMHSMHDKLRHYHNDFEVAGVYNETHPSWGPQGMILYFYTWLLRNPNGDLKAEVNRYYQNYYGPAAGDMARYHEELEKEAWGGAYFGSGGSGIETLFSRRLITSLQQKIEAAEKAAAGLPPFERRVAGVAAGFHYAKLVREFIDLKEQGQAEAGLAKLKELKNYFYSFADGSVFDNRNSEKGHWDSRLFDRYHSEIEKEAKMKAHFINPTVEQIHEHAWRFQIDPEDRGRADKWFEAMDDSDWPKLRAGNSWQAQGFPDHQGVAWYRREFRPPVMEDGKRMILYFEAVDGDAEVYLNGTLQGVHRLDAEMNGWDEPFYFDITDTIAPDQANLLVVRVEKRKYVGGITQPVRIVSVDQIRPPE